MSATAIAEDTQPLELPYLRPGLPPRADTPAMPMRRLDAESRAWLVRLHGVGPVRDGAIAELHERLRREAWFHLRLRTSGMSEFPAE